MFTGIVEEIGRVQHVTRSSQVSRLTIQAHKVLEDVHLGDSIAVNGICLTVVSFTSDEFTVDVMNETWQRTSLFLSKNHAPVNLERAMPADGRFGGHIISGHIDGVGTVRALEQDGNALWFHIDADERLCEGMVEKGSIALDGTSLTLARVGSHQFSVSLIPHTLSHTVLQFRQRGDRVNIEMDVIGKYVQKWTQATHRGIDETFLRNCGF